jgi:hypothetical protein
MAEQTPEMPNMPEDQAREQTGQQRVQLRIDERDLTTSYANAFRTNGTAEEVMLDFGFNQMLPAQQGQQQTEGQDQTPQILFKINNRIIMNYYTAKRMAITLSQLIRRHEQQFGELELDVSKRTQTSQQG